MSYVEHPLIVDCDGEYLVGVLAAPAKPEATGVLIVVGGPQYRVGSHRQFVQLSRRLASEGFAVLRFDYRGMGDAVGESHTFENCETDIAAAIDALFARCAGVKRVVLWGLCDAASAILIYLQERRDARIAGVVLLNPWVRSASTLSKTHLKHYYRKRLIDRDFWTKLIHGHVEVGKALRAFAKSARTAAQGSRTETPTEPPRFQDRMLEGWRTFSRPALVILSGNDLTAKEFLEYTQADPAWRSVMRRRDIERQDLPGADHTFSTPSSSAEVEARTLRWLTASFSRDPR